MKKTEFSYFAESKNIFTNPRFLIGGGIAIILLMIIPLVHFIDFIRIDEFRNVWSTPEFLINYEGGFVRRGLIGEGLFLLSKFTGINPLLAVNIFCTLCYLVVSGLFLKYFKKQGWTWWLVFSIYLCGYTSCIIRKDYMLFLIIFAIFSMIRKMGMKEDSAKNFEIPVILGIILLVILAMMAHEAFIFFGLVPACLYLWRVKQKIAMAYIIAGIGIIMFLLAVACHGSEAISSDIVKSWNNLLVMPTLPDKGAIDAIGWKTYNTFRYHLITNMLPPSHILWHRGWLTHVLGFLTWSCKFLLAYYVLTNFPSVFMREGDEMKRLKIRDCIGGMLLLTWLVMLPMFTILCCELSRTIQFWAMGTFIPILMTGKNGFLEMVPHKFANIASKINSFLTRLIAPRGWLILILILLLLISLNLTIINHGILGYSIPE